MKWAAATMWRTRGRSVRRSKVTVKNAPSPGSANDTVSQRPSTERRCAFVARSHSVFGCGSAGFCDDGTQRPRGEFWSQRRVPITMPPPSPSTAYDMRFGRSRRQRATIASVGLEARCSMYVTPASERYARWSSRTVAAADGACAGTSNVATLRGPKPSIDTRTRPRAGTAAV